MKRLGVVISLILLSVSLFGGFSTPQKTHAQSANIISYNSTNYTHDTAKGNVAKIFDNYTVAINQGLDAASKLQTDEGKARYEIYKTLAPKLLTAVSTAKTVYLNSYDTKLSPPEAQIKALTETQKSLGSSIPPLSGDMNKIQAMSIYNAFQAQLRTELEIAKTINSGGSSGNLNSNPDAIANAQTQTDKIVSAQDTGTCTLWRWSLVACINEGITWIIKNTLLEFAGFLLWASANIFNTSIQVGILHFSDWAPDTLYPIWIIIRQIISLAIVFIGLYLGFMYILGKEETFERYIPWVVMFGLFVNFSYPLIRTAIDISNIISLNIYASAVGSSALSGTSENTAGALIVSALGLSGLVFSATTNTTGNMLGELSSVPAALAAVAFVAYAAFIFIRVTIIMIGRTVSLVFLTIASPLLLVDAVIPVLGERAKFLRKILFEQLAVGPVFMIMLALTLKFLEVFHTTGALTSSGLGSLSGPVSTTIPVFFNIIMMLIMLHIMIKVTVSVSGTVGTWATEGIGKVGGFGLGVAAGGAGLLARKGLGGLALKARESEWVKKNENSFLGRRAYDLSNSVANSTFDLRNSTYVAGAAKKLGMGMGMGSKLGHEEIKNARDEKRVKSVMARADRIKTKYERDGIGSDGKWHRKGEEDEEAVKRREEYLSNNGGALFLTKDQRNKLGDTYVDETGGQLLANYKKEGKDGKKMFTEQVKKEMDELKRSDPKLESNRGMALSRVMHDIEKEEKGIQENLNKEVLRVENELKDMSEEKKKDYFARQSADVKEAIIAKRSGGSASASSQEATKTLGGPLAGAALREERIRKVEEGRAAEVDRAQKVVDQKDSTLVDSDTKILAEAKDKQNRSIENAAEFSINTSSFAQRVAQKRQMQQKLVQQRADAGGAANASISQPHPPEVRPSSIPVQSSSKVVTPPVPPAANSSQTETSIQPESTATAQA